MIIWQSKAKYKTWSKATLSTGYTFYLLQSQNTMTENNMGKKKQTKTKQKWGKCHQMWSIHIQNWKNVWLFSSVSCDFKNATMSSNWYDIVQAIYGYYTKFKRRLLNSLQVKANITASVLVSSIPRKKKKRLFSLKTCQSQPHYIVDDSVHPWNHHTKFIGWDNSIKFKLDQTAVWPENTVFSFI